MPAAIQQLDRKEEKAELETISVEAAKSVCFKPPKAPLLHCGGKSEIITLC